MEPTSERTKKVLLTIAFICLAIVGAMAQGPGFDDDVEDTPIDGGATLIAIVAAGYGVKRITQRKEQ